MNMRTGKEEGGDGDGIFNNGHSFFGYHLISNAICAISFIFFYPSLPAHYGLESRILMNEGRHSNCNKYRNRPFSSVFQSYVATRRSLKPTKFRKTFGFCQMCDL
jgi:hypothetical protein